MTAPSMHRLHILGPLRTCRRQPSETRHWRNQRHFRSPDRSRIAGRAQESESAYIVENMKSLLLQPGDIIGDKYHVVKLLGRGGMGMVYLAEHERLRRPVAIKVLHSHFDDMRGAVLRFEREIRSMAIVNSPHVARALDADMMEDGSLYLVMEYLEGHDLREEQRLRRRIPYPEAVAYIIQACAGVAAAHDAGVIHRDLKPHNLFVTNLNGARQIKILDFGIAKSLVSLELTVTARDAALGTPLYMSPEQLRTPDDISMRSDVWALGVVLYELIAGVSPFAAETPGAVVAAVVLQDLVPLAALTSDVPRGLSDVISAALVKAPAHRITSTRELADRLAPFSMPVNEIFVHDCSPSQAYIPVIPRSTHDEEMVARIEREVAEFDSSRPPHSSRSRVDECRLLPSLAKLAIAPRLPSTVPPPRCASGSAEVPVSDPDNTSPTLHSLAVSASPRVSAAMRGGHGGTAPATRRYFAYALVGGLVAASLLMLVARRSGRTVASASWPAAAPALSAQVSATVTATIAAAPLPSPDATHDISANRGDADGQDLNTHPLPARNANSERASAHPNASPGQAAANRTPLQL